ncbi:hypothetical protein L8R88_00645 [Vibrio aestuarianus]|nr:hypothetical protein [Vibrio aestuarianus]MDH5906591.1 hypothetical protein [Vibrio aestuarianus]MDH5979908.1 hypothetical protein [Vibrio aestuarianus]MDH6020064.1 hypothetical protein [Vibrio aestuarianus]
MNYGQRKRVEAIQQTQLNKNFVKALHAEVEDRIANIKEVLFEQYQLLNDDHNELIGENKELENGLS